MPERQKRQKDWKDRKTEKTERLKRQKDWKDRKTEKTERLKRQKDWKDRKTERQKNRKTKRQKDRKDIKDRKTERTKCMLKSYPNFKQEANIAIGSITITGPRSSVVDFSIPYYETGAGYLAHIPRELSKWAALLRPYKINVWIPLIFSLLLAGPIFWMISQQYAKSHHRLATVQQCYETTYRVIVVQGKQKC
jgi:hypothetical protein